MASVHTMDQRSAEWFETRCGKVTASKIADLIAKTKTGWGASRANYKAQLVCERLTGCVEPSYQNDAMRWGIEKEPDALAAYCFRQDVDVLEVGFVDHPRIGNTGASPDGLIGEDGLIEVKCPMSAAHIETLLGQSVPSKYVHQMQWQMACTGRQWCDFVSFDPRLPPAMQFFLRRVERDNTLIAELEAYVIDFLGEVDDTVAKLRAQYEREAA